MDNFELTKIAGAVLAALLLIFGTKTVVEMRTGHNAGKPGYSLPGTEPPAAEAKAGAKAPPPAKPEAAAKAEATKDAAAPAGKKTAEAPKDPATPAAAPAKSDAAPAAASGNAGADTFALLSKASADNGKAIFSKCKSCHIAEKGKTSTVGPNLWGVVNRARGSYEGFTYSEGMKAKNGPWTFEEIGNFINNPKGYVQGTKMVFNGLPDAADRADVIAYLATLADTPVALPK